MDNIGIILIILDHGHKMEEYIWEYIYLGCDWDPDSHRMLMLFGIYIYTYILREYEIPINHQHVCFMVIEPGDDMGISPATSRCVTFDHAACLITGGLLEGIAVYSIFMAGKLLETAEIIERIIEDFLKTLHW